MRCRIISNEEFISTSHMNYKIASNMELINTLYGYPNVSSKLNYSEIDGIHTSRTGRVNCSNLNFKIGIFDL